MRVGQSALHIGSIRLTDRAVTAQFNTGACDKGAGGHYDRIVISGHIPRFRDSQAVDGAGGLDSHGDAAKAQMVIEKLPEIARSVAEPISSINDVRIYGNTGDGISQISGQVPTVIKQTMDTVADATGVDMTKIIEQSTLESAVKRTADKPEK